MFCIFLAKRNFACIASTCAKLFLQNRCPASQNESATSIVQWTWNFEPVSTSNQHWVSFCPKNRLLFCCEFLQLLFQTANVPHPVLATGNGRANKRLERTNRDLEAVLASGSMTKCEPTWYDHHVDFWDVLVQAMLEQTKMETPKFSF